jgi:hypothetical protein
LGLDKIIVSVELQAEDVYTEEASVQKQLRGCGIDYA